MSVEPLRQAGKVRISWRKPLLKAGQEVTGYSVEYREMGDANYNELAVSGLNNTSCTISHLRLGTVYEVRVAAVGPLGLSKHCCGNGREVTTYNSE